MIFVILFTVCVALASSSWPALLLEMLIKEYRIPLPLTVDEYRIAQLYMIAVRAVRIIVDKN